MQPKLIVLNGFAGVGKSTIAQLYRDKNPLTMAIEGDQIIGMIGCWAQHEPEARVLKLAHVKALIQTHLRAGHDVVLPYLVTEATDVTEFEAIAAETGALFYEVVLMTEPDEAVDRLLERGCWGEVGTKPLTAADRTRIEALYEMMIENLEKRPNMQKISVHEGDIKGTYTSFTETLS